MKANWPFALFHPHNHVFMLTLTVLHDLWCQGGRICRSHHKFLARTRSVSVSVLGATFGPATNRTSLSKSLQYRQHRVMRIRQRARCAAPDPIQQQHRLSLSTVYERFTGMHLGGIISDGLRLLVRISTPHYGLSLNRHYGLDRAM
jgi:hypothetical protein